MAQKNWNLTFYVRLVHITEELISNILHEDGSKPRRAGVHLTFYVRIVAFAPRINSDLRQYTVAVLTSIIKRYMEIQKCCCRSTGLIDLEDDGTTPPLHRANIPKDCNSNLEPQICLRCMPPPVRPSPAHAVGGLWDEGLPALNSYSVVVFCMQIVLFTQQLAA